MIKTVATFLVITLIFPSALLAAPSEEVQRQAAGDSWPAPATPTVGQGSRYSPTAEKAYLGTAIGTFVAGGAFVGLGAGASNSDQMASDAAATVLYVVGGTFLAASTILWILYFREKGKEPATTVGLELGKGRGGVQAKFRF